MSKRKKRIVRHNRQKITIEATNTGFSGYFHKLPVYSTGKSIGELLINLKGSLDLYLEHVDEVKNSPRVPLESEIKE